MVRDMSEHGTQSSRIKLINLLTGDSEFLEALRDSLTDIWDNLKVFSFYELWKTPTVQKEINILEIFPCILRADVFSLAYYGRVE